MISRLENEINTEHRKVVVDTCALHPGNCNFNDNFFDGWDGFKEITPEQVENSMGMIKSLDGFINSDSLVILPEVLTEMKGYFEPMNTYIQDFRKFLKSGQEKQAQMLNALREYGDKFYSLIKTVEHPDFRLCFDVDRKEDYEDLNGLIDSEREMTKGLLTKDYALRFYDHFVAKRAHWARITPDQYNGRFSVDYQEYHDFLKLALDRSRNKRISLLEDPDSSKRPGKFGILYDTDSKLLAATFSLSRYSPVTLISRDRGMELLFYEMSSILKGNSDLRINGLEYPAFPPKFVVPETMPQQSSAR